MTIQAKMNQAFQTIQANTVLYKAWNDCKTQAERDEMMAEVLWNMAYNQGCEDGHEEGYEEGYASGYDAGTSVPMDDY